MNEAAGLWERVAFDTATIFNRLDTFYLAFDFDFRLDSTFKGRFINASAGSRMSGTWSLNGSLVDLAFQNCDQYGHDGVSPTVTAVPCAIDSGIGVYENGIMTHIFFFSQTNVIPSTHWVKKGSSDSASEVRLTQLMPGNWLGFDEEFTFFGDFTYSGLLFGGEAEEYGTWLARGDSLVRNPDSCFINIVNRVPANCSDWGGDRTWQVSPMDGNYFIYRQSLYANEAEPFASVARRDNPGTFLNPYKRDYKGRPGVIFTYLPDLVIVKLGYSGPHIIQMFDVSGRMLREVTVMGPGLREVHLSSSKWNKLKQGVYLLRAITPSGTTEQTLIR